MSRRSRANTRRYKRNRPTHHSLPSATRSWSGWIGDPKCGRIFYRSAIELDFFVHLIFDPAVSAFGRNDLEDYEIDDLAAMGLPASARARVVLPLELPDGRTRGYTPDVWVQLSDGRLVLVEIGPHDAKTAGDEAVWLQAAAVKANGAGYSFLTATDAALRGTLNDNLQKLFGHLTAIAATDEMVEAAHQILRESVEQLSVNEALSLLRQRLAETPASVLEEAICVAVARAKRMGRLRCDLESGIWALDTKLSIAPSDSDELPSFVVRLVEGGGAHLPVGFRPMRSQLRRPTSLDLQAPSESDPQALRRKALFDGRLALVRDREAHLDEEWSAFAARHGVTVSHAKYWWTEYQQGGGAAALEPEVRVRPGLRVWKKERVRGTDGRWHSVAASPEDTDAVRRLIKRIYSQSRKHKARSVLEHPEFRAKLGEIGARVEYAGVCRYIRTFLKGDRRVTASREEDRLFSPSPTPTYTRRSARYLLHIVEADATDADVLLVGFDGKTVVARLVIMYAVDVRSRMPWSWLVLVGDPDETDYKRLFHRGISPKTDLCQCRSSRDAQRGTEYPCFGLPTLIALDRAWAGSARGCIDDAESLGMRLTFAPPLTPELKAHVERLIGTVHQRLLHRLPGTTKENPLKKGGRDAVAEALKYGLTVSNFIALFDVAMLDGFPNELHTSLGRTPRDEWETREREEGRPRRYPMTDASRLRLELFPLRALGSRELTGAGYNLKTFTFKPDGRGAPDPALLYGDVDDARTVAVYRPGKGRPPVYWGEAVNREIPLEVAIGFEEAKALYKPAVSGKGRTAPDETLFDIVAAAEAGRKVTRRGATRVEAMRQANQRPLRSGAAAAIASVKAASGPAALPAPRLVLDRAPDFEVIPDRY